MPLPPRPYKLPRHRFRKGRLTAPQCWHDRFMDMYWSTGLTDTQWMKITGSSDYLFNTLLNGVSYNTGKPYFPEPSTLAVIARLEHMYAEEIARYRANPQYQNFQARMRRGEPVARKVDTEKIRMVASKTGALYLHLATARVRELHEKGYFRDLRAARAATRGTYREIVESWSHN